MANLFGTGINQIPTNGMLGNLAFQDKAYVSVDAVGIGSTFVDSGTVGQPLQVSGGAYVSGNIGIGTTTPTSKLHVIGDVRVSGITTTAILNVGTGGTIITTTSAGLVGIGTASPSFTADIAGDVRVTSENKMRFGGTAGTTNFYIQHNSTTNSLDFVAG